jgi:hypothetical protein
MGKKEKESKRGLEEKLFLLLLSLGLWVLFSFEGLAVVLGWWGHGKRTCIWLASRRHFDFLAAADNPLRKEDATFTTTKDGGRYNNPLSLSVLLSIHPSPIL